MSFADKQLECRECGTTFIFSAGEQEFYQLKGLVNEPQRCPSCRARRREQRLSGAPREMFPVTCSQCGAPAMVPFQPRLDKPVYCSSCFDQVRGTNY